MTTARAGIARKLWTYCGIAYGIPWFVVPGLYAPYREGAITRNELDLYFSFGALGPAIGAVAGAAIFYGEKGVAALLGTLGPSRLERRSLLALSPLPLFAFGPVVHLLLAGAPFSSRRHNMRSALPLRHRISRS